MVIAVDDPPRPRRRLNEPRTDTRTRNLRAKVPNIAQSRWPFRCLHSVDLDNVMMAGKHISVSHIAGSVTKFMGNGAQHAIATAAAALCVKYETTAPTSRCPLR